ncbi:ACT domain-containing protein [Desertimonas flava]|uniref:ACT domain-containing protein n=1 Tax=Desertimonas flava TaxID=2064846 RepID=UPI000E354D1C|nr:ACT domain-containing protein [Desertimonas flava]
MTITLIAAVAANGTIGAAGGMPWHLPEDLERFKAMTTGHTLVMGRKTYESIGRPLPGRRTLVITRDPRWSADGVAVTSSLDAALEHAPGETVFVAGGGEIYAQTIDRADRLEITHVHRAVEGDTAFPTIDPDRWQVEATDERDGFAFVTYGPRAAPVRRLDDLLAGLQPVLHPGEYVYVLAGADDRHIRTKPVVVVHEAEGKTLVIDAGAAGEAGFPTSPRFAWITLEVHSDLEAVGLTAAVATALTDEGIACNVVAGFHHDHLFVPIGRAGDAIDALTRLSAAPPGPRP